MRNFVQIKDGQPQIWPIAASNVWRYAPDNTGFPLDCTDADLSEFGFFTLEPTAMPAFDAAIKKAVDTTPIKSNGKWLQQWRVFDLTADEIAARQPKITTLKTDIWRRCTTNEAEMLDGALDQAPAQLRRMFDAATIIEHDAPEFPALREGIAAALGGNYARADEILAASE